MFKGELAGERMTMYKTRNLKKLISQWRPLYVRKLMMNHPYCILNIKIKFKNKSMCRT